MPTASASRGWVVAAMAVLLAAGLVAAQTGTAAPTAAPTDFLDAAVQLGNESQVEVSLPGTDEAFTQFGARIRTCARDAVSGNFFRIAPLKKITIRAES